MKMRELGKTGLPVSELCLGAMYFGWREPRESSLERLDQFTGAGGNFIDTANIYAEHFLRDKDYFGKDIGEYHDGGSERLIGAWLKARGGRDKLVIASKVGFPYPGCPYGTRGKQIKEECEKSLLRLGTDYLDLYYLHSDDRATPMDESLAALSDLVKEGKVRFIGASNFKAWRLAKAAEISKSSGFASYCCVQQRHTYLRGRLGQNFGGQLETNDDLFDYVRESGITLLAYSPLLSGYYNNRGKALKEQYVGPDSDARMRELDEVATETGKTPGQIVYRWMMQSEPSVLPLVASSNAAQFEEALGALEFSLTPEQMQKLDKAGA